MRDPYEILGLKPGAQPVEMKAAFRKLAKRYHPDSNSDAQSRTRFEEVAKAYQTLMERQSAPGSEDFVPAAPKPAATAPAAEFKPATDTKTESGFSEIFGGLQRRAKNVFRARGSDIPYRLKIDFLEAALGASRRITLPGEKVLDVRIPAGIADGQQIRLKGQGEDGFGGAEAGDALISIEVEPHMLFRREGLDIHMTLPVSLTEAVLGARIEAPTIHGPVALTVPAGSNNGTRLRLKGRGILQGDEAGDHYAVLELKLPETPDPALRAFAAGWETGQAHSPRKDMPRP